MAASHGLFDLTGKDGIDQLLREGGGQTGAFRLSSVPQQQSHVPRVRLNRSRIGGHIKRLADYERVLSQQALTLFDADSLCHRARPFP